MVQNITNTFHNLPSSPPDIPMKSYKNSRTISNHRVNAQPIEPTNEHLFRKTIVETSKFEFDLSIAGVIRKYKIQILKKSNGTVKNLQMYPQNEIVIIERQQLLLRIVNEFLLTERFPGGVAPSSVVYDRKQHIYTPRHVGEYAFSVIEFDKISDGQLRDDLGSKTEQLIIKLSFEKEFNPATVTDDDGIYESKRFLFYLLQADAFQKGYFGNGSAIYQTYQEDSFINGKSLKNGIAFMLETKGTSETENKFSFEVIPVKKPYRKAMNLLDYVCHEMGMEKLALTEALQYLDKREKLFKDICGMYVCSVNNKMYFQIHGLQKNNELMFLDNKSKQDVTCIANFILNNRGGLKYPYLPLIVRKQEDKMSYYPMENLVVPLGQRVKLNQWNTDVIIEASKKTLMLPQEYKKIIQEFMYSTLRSDNEYLKAFKIKISSNMPQMHAKTVIPPMIRYAFQSMAPSFNSNVDPTLIWDAKPYTHFVRPAKLTKWALMVLDKCVTKLECSSFIHYLKHLGSGHQMSIENESHILFVDSEDDNCLKRQVNEIVSDTLQILIVVAHEATTAVADKMRTIEVSTGIATHLFSKQDVLQTEFGKGGHHFTLPMQMINAKCGGLNFDVNVPKGVACSLKEKDRLISSNLRRMYIGLSICIGENEKTKAIAMTYTIANVCEPKSMIWYEQNNTEGITNLSAKVCDAIRDYERSNWFRPTEIVVYRNSTKDEAADVTAEFQHIKESILMTCPGYRPSLTMLSVECDNNPHFLKTKIIDIASASRQNVSPGLVVDCDEYGKKGFYLVSNKSDKGTVSSVKFNIVGTKPGYTTMLTTDELKWITNALSYANQFANSPGSVPSILTAATNVAARALLALRIAIDEKRLENPGTLKRKLNSADTSEKFKQMTELLKDKIEGRHW